MSAVRHAGRVSETQVHQPPSPTRTTPYVLSSRPDTWDRLAVDSLALAAVTVLLAIVVLRAWDLSLRVPFDYDGDGLLSLQWAKTMIETGWVNSNPRLGAPFGQVYYDLPLGGDNLQFLVLRGITLLSSDWVLVTNLFFLLGFPVAAVSAYLSQRWLGVTRRPAFAASLVYAFLPYHFYRGTEHLLLASYAIVPVAVLLAARAASGMMPWAPTQPAPSRPTSARKALPWLLLVAALGSCGAYYFAFGLLLVVIAGVLASVRSSTVRPLAAAAATAGLSLAVFVVNVSGSWLYWRSHGSNRLVLRRSIGELDKYSLRVTELVTPVPSHWFPPFRWIAEHLVTTTPTAETAQFLGTIGALAILGMVAALLMACVGRRQPGGDTGGLLVALTVVCVLVGTAGGFAWLGNLVGFTEIRAWSRVSVVIGFLALAWLALVVGRWAAGWEASRPRPRGVIAVCFAGVAVVGVFDQMPDPALPWAGEGAARDFDSDRAYFAAIEKVMPAGAMIYQFPYHPFPEQRPTYLSTDYDLSRPFLNSRELRWSYGGMRGREAEWQQNLVNEPVPQLLDDLVAARFSGVLVDRFGYPDRGVEFEQQLRTALTVSPVVDSTNRWAFYDLSAYAPAVEARLGRAALDRRRDDLLAALWLDRTGCSSVEGSGASSFTWCGPEGSLVVTSEQTPRRVRFRASVRAPAGNATLSIAANGRNHTVPLGTEPTPIEFDIDLADRETEVAFKTDARQVAAADSRELRFQLIDAKVVGT
jgi:hypothetical protein